MLKLIKFIKVKILLLFIFTIILGLWTAGFFEQYKFYFGITKTFSQTEAKNLVGKRVRDKCAEKIRGNIKVGLIIGYSGRNFNNIYSQIKLDDEEFPYTSFPKDYFERCVEVEN